MSENPEQKKDKNPKKKVQKKKIVKVKEEVRLIEPDIRPWDQQPEEPNKAYSWFLTYRDLGEGRTLRKAFSKETKKLNGTISDMSRKWNWVHRCNLFDIFVKQERWKKRMVSQDQINENVDRLSFATSEKLLEGVIALRPERMTASLEKDGVKVVNEFIRVHKGDKITASVNGKVNLNVGMTEELKNAFMEMEKKSNDAG
jgi:hypothetical protein